LGCNCDCHTPSVPLLSGFAGVEQTVDLARRLVDDGVKDPFVNRTAINVLQQAGTSTYDPEAAAHALWQFVTGFTFVNDPVGPYGPKETLRPARVVLDVRAGDCDDLAVVLCSLLGTIGMTTRLVTIAADPEAPSEFSHIYPEVQIGQAWVPVDPARPNTQFGVAPPHHFRKEIWSLTDRHHASVKGVNFLNGPSVQRAMGAYIHLGDATSDQIAEDFAIGANAAAGIVANATNSPLLAYPPAGYPTTVPATASLSLSSNSLLLPAILVAVIFMVAKK
jgi:Transglutaminase-like superfamily